jgi:hypothetical protein
MATVSLPSPAEQAMTGGSRAAAPVSTREGRKFVSVVREFFFALGVAASGHSVS